ncbi:diacylglycerol kinase theta-like isoform X1 [Amphibalanus amphitrite]|uniref:diacylglycerol kinase theta-like isoform X1 n=2 Tax=Amphibalanus amphitrite TaxID=1232801 RepID=UPI001C91EC57|nr:diacylglycerol kinase theta-like isoform X1 [Amphibalanus amphitrite]
MAAVPSPESQGHFFVKKTFHRPTYCHHCTDLLWGFIGQGYICEVCNFVIHDRCRTNVVSPCFTIAAAFIKNPVAHCWVEPGHYKRRFCNICRKRLDDTWALRCEVCEYYVHVDCQEFAVPNCKTSSEFIPGQKVSEVQHAHLWREGNLPSNSKCAVCRKTCWSSECLTGMRCEWCVTTVHAPCMKYIPPQCKYGAMEPLVLPPSAVSFPRTEVPRDILLGMISKRKEAIPKDFSAPRSISEEFSSGEVKSHEDGLEQKNSRESSKKKQNDEQDDVLIKVFDGNCSLRRRMFRTIAVSRSAATDAILSTALAAFHIGSKSADKYYLSDAYCEEEAELDGGMLVRQLCKRDGRRPAVFLRLRQETNHSGYIRVHPQQLRVQEEQLDVPVSDATTCRQVIEYCLRQLGLTGPDDYTLSEVLIDRNVNVRELAPDERPWELMKSISRDSVLQMTLARFHLAERRDPHGPSVPLFVGNLPLNLNQRQYEKILLAILGRANKFSSIGPIYYEYGSLVIVYNNAEDGTRAYYALQEASYEDKHLLVMILPSLSPELIPPGVRPVLFFVNVKSGGCQGLELITSFRRMVNPSQVFDLDNGGPLPGLYVFRKVPDYRILVCGGDGTIGWVLQCLDNVGQDSECSSPPCAIVPLGTGNDLARVLRWGPGYSGGEDPNTLLRDVIDAEEVRLDRWTVVFHPDDKGSEVDFTKSALPNSQCSTSEDNTQIFVMNNYFGIGIDADLCLDFHNAREENPDKFNSRLHNKGVYVKMGLRKMMSRKMCKDLHRHMKVEVDGKPLELPPVEGIIILNILSWGSGANPWGPEKDDQFGTPNHWDGMLEIVGVTGVVHLGQIQSGLRSSIRVAQGGHIRIHLHTDMPVQVDGEPWVQPAGEVVVLKSALKATMLKKLKSTKLRRRSTEPSLGGGAQLVPTASSPAGERV